MIKSTKILLVDDDKDLIQILQIALDMQGFRVVVSTNGQEAAFKFRNEDFDLVITDLRMPKMDGIEFLTSIHKIKETPVIIISASLDLYKYKIKELKYFNNLTILPKPFDPDDLIEKIKEVCKPIVSKETPSDNMLIFKAGETVFEEDSAPSDLFIVKEGTFKIFKTLASGEKISVAVVRQGEVLGEMSIFSGQKRSSTVVAESDGVLIRFPIDKIKETLNAQPAWFKILMKTISTRLSNTTTALAEAQAELAAREKK